MKFILGYLVLVVNCLGGHMFAQSSDAQLIYIHCGNLIDTEKGTSVGQKTIVVTGEYITDIMDGLKNPPAGAQLIDLSKWTVMPGFIDLHVHIESESNSMSYLEKYTLNEADRAFLAQMFGQRTLQAGFTSVRDLGGTGVNVAYRNAINEGIAIGPRVFTAEKSIATTGGHADPTNGSSRLFMGDPGPDAGVVNSPEEGRKAVRQRYKNGADCIKVTATGGVLSVAASGLNPQFMQDELEAIVQTARDYGFHVAAHAHGAEGMKRAVLAGVRTIEHGTYMNDEIIKLMKERGTFYVPTISAGRFVADKARVAGFYPKMVALKASQIGPQIQETFTKAYKAGVRIAFGTDSGVSLHGDNANEFLLMVESGMPAIEAIQSATITAAEVLDMSDKLGSIAKGKYADIIATEGNPIHDIQSVKRVKFVMKNGVVYKSGGE
jgi:imidazolonepropionase-like amidohydrolase